MPLKELVSIACFALLLSASSNSRGQCYANPVPNAVATPSSQAICSGSSITPITITGNIPGTVFNWVRDNTSSVTGIASSGTGNISGFLTNTTNAPVSANFTITPQVTGPIQLINETFNTVSPLPAGWAQQNMSSPVGTAPTWFLGTAFPPFSPTGFIAASYNNTTAGNLVSNWLFTPQVSISNGDRFSFYTRTSGTAPFPDRLQLRMSTNGASTNVGSSNVSVGDFTYLLLDINPTFVSNGYPDAWTKYTITLSGLPASLSGRFAFRYLTTNGGAPAANSSMIGIDDVVYATSGVTTCTGPPVTATVIVNPLPAVSITSNIAPPILPGQVLTLTAVVSPPGGTFVWYKDGNVIPGATASTLGGITVTDLGTYTVKYTDLNGCSNIAAGFIVFARQSNGLFIHPNPNNGHFRVTFYNESNEEVTVTVYNSSGGIVIRTKNITGTAPYAKAEIEMPVPYRNGIYSVEVRNAKNHLIGASHVIIGR